MKEIKYVKGDATNPIGEGRKILIHCCNTIGVMGAGIAKTIRNKWPIVYVEYNKTYISKGLNLGETQFIKVNNDLVVANMIGQEGIGFVNGIPPIRYEAIDSCLKRVSETAKKYNASVHAPRICCGLAGGKWETIEKLIVKNLCENDIGVTIYDFEGE